MRSDDGRQGRRAQVVSGFSHPLEGRRSRHPYLPASQGRVRQSAVKQNSGVTSNTINMSLESVVMLGNNEPRWYGRVVGHSEVIQFDGSSANRRLRAADTPWVTRKGRALYGQVAVPMRLPDAGRLPRNIFHPVQIGCELACSQQLYSVTIALAA